MGVPYGSSGKSQRDATIDRYNEKYVGVPRDAVLLHFGPPDRSYKLDSGARIMEYKSTIRRKPSQYNVSRETCTLRFWYKTDTIIFVDYRGAVAACDNLVDFNQNYMGP